MTVKERATLARSIAVPKETIPELVQLSDLMMINGVGPIFARILYETGVNAT